MATNINEAGNVISIKRGRGRPAGTGKKRLEAVARAEEIMANAGSRSDDTRRAPAFGSNEPDIGVFLKHVQILRAKETELEAAKLKVKAINKQKKDLRQAAKAEGLVLGELDRALKDADTEQVDLVAREQRYHLYMDWLGKPIGFQPSLDLAVKPEDEEARWFKRGDQDGRLGKDRTPPEGCPPDRIQAFLKGWEHGQDQLMRANPVTAPAFSTEAPKSPPETAGNGWQPSKQILTLHEQDFQAGIDIEDANRSTIFDDATLQAFDAAENVVAVFGKAKRVLKEPGYVDDGTDDCPITDTVPVAGIDAEEFA